MSNWVRRKGTRFKVSFKLAIGASSRSAVDVEIDRLRRSVIPVIGADERMRPRLVGSAVALEHRRGKVLVTAAHVLSDNASSPLFFFGADGNSRALSPDFIVSAKHDIAARVLSEAELGALSHIPFLPQQMIGRPAPVGETFYASVVGYPASAAKRVDRSTLETPMEAYSNFATESMDGGISVLFGKKDGARGLTGHVTPPDPFGKSGGAIFGFTVSGRNVVPLQPTRLVGFATRWKRLNNRIEGTGAGALLALLGAE